MAEPTVVTKGQRMADSRVEQKAALWAFLTADSKVECWVVHWAASKVLLRVDCSAALTVVPKGSMTVE
jgi:hypothetical protein